MEKSKPYYQQPVLTKTQETKKKRRKYPNVFFSNELKDIFAGIKEPETAIGAFLAFFCALRISEVCSLKWIDIDLDEKRLKVVNGKNHKDGFVPVSSVCIPVLNAWRAMNPSEEYFLPGNGKVGPYTTSALLKSFRRALNQERRRKSRLGFNKAGVPCQGTDTIAG